jgi:glucosamine-6-phosphate deaminase
MKKNTLRVIVEKSKKAAGIAAAKRGAALIRAAVRQKGRAAIVVATGASQLEMLDQLTKEPGIHWPAVTGFHLDEYVGLPITHPASFRKYLWERFVSRLPLPMAAFHFVDGESDPKAECRRLARLIRRQEVDVCFCGIGENGHLAFNDPPADFQTREPYIVVRLDEACRRQQLGEGWFASLAKVPRQAISMSIRQMMKSRAIICTVPERRKAQAVRDCLQGPVTPEHPASILQRHPAAWCYLDRAAASRLAR